MSVCTKSWKLACVCLYVPKVEKLPLTVAWRCRETLRKFGLRERNIVGDGKSGEGDKLRLKEFECDRSTSYVCVLKYVSASCFIGSSYCTAIYVSSCRQLSIPSGCRPAFWQSRWGNFCICVCYSVSLSVCMCGWPLTIPFFVHSMLQSESAQFRRYKPHPYHCSACTTVLYRHRWKHDCESKYAVLRL